ncbi:MAG: hypothetical protein ACYDA6_01255 [Solirubrobacteraceae bacterium]
MPRFVTIGYGDRAGYDRTDPAIRDAAHRHDEALLAAGAVMGIAGQPVQVRNHDGAGVDASAGAFLRSDLPVNRGPTAALPLIDPGQSVPRHRSRGSDSSSESRGRFFCSSNWVVWA